MKIGEFFISLFVDAGKGELTVGNLVQSMGALEVATVGEIAALFALANKLATITDLSIKSALGFEAYASATGASTKALQEWQAVGAHVGITGETVASSLAAISQGLVGLKKFGENSPLANLLQPLHMSLEKYKNEKPEKLLEDIRNNPFFQQMDAATKVFVLQKAGIAGMLRALSKGEGGVSDENFNRFISEAGAMPKSDIDRYQEINSQFVSVWEITKRIQQVIASWFSKELLTTLNFVVGALHTIAEFIDNRKKHTVAGDIGKIVTSGQGGMENLSNMPPEQAAGMAIKMISAYMKAALSSENSLKSFINGPLYDLLGPDEFNPKKTSPTFNINHNSVTNIHGATLGKNEMRDAIKDAHIAAWAPVIVQLNTGVA